MKNQKMEEAEKNKVILFQSDKSTIGMKRFLRAYCKESSNSDFLLEHFSYIFQKNYNWCVWGEKRNFIEDTKHRGHMSIPEKGSSDHEV